MTPFRLTDTFRNLLVAAGELAAKESADALLILVDGNADWERLKQLSDAAILCSNDKSPTVPRVLVAVTKKDHLREASDAGLSGVIIPVENLPIHDRITQALLEAVADDLIPSSGVVVVLYSGFEAEEIDSVTIVDLADRLRRFTGRHLRELETAVPLPLLKTVVDLAVEIGREGREGKPVGTMFVVGDTRRVLTHSHPLGFDPVRGYSRKERNLFDAKVREAVKEIAQLDGAIIIAADGTVEAACRFINAPAENITLSKGLGARHWAAAAITKATKAVAVTVSESTGTVRIFQNGEVVRRIEPSHRRPLVWMDAEREPPPFVAGSHTKSEAQAEAKGDGSSAGSA
ncbi:MAG: diadenylate cyclase [Thermoguttaceae bacterium]|nr:diadenylate cyclase [Thermoguttaceae bacterium]MDW8077277.1 diadenylate cyclase [Thermoguttaceae bacterium]